MLWVSFRRNYSIVAVGFRVMTSESSYVIILNCPSLQKSVIWCHYSNQLSLWAIASWLPLISSHLVALLHSIHTIRKKLLCLDFPENMNLRKSFMCFKFITQCDCRKSMQKGTEARWTRKGIWWIVTLTGWCWIWSMTQVVSPDCPIRRETILCNLSGEERKNNAPNF